MPREHDLGFMLSLKDNMSKSIKGIEGAIDDLTESIEKAERQTEKDFDGVGGAIEKMGRKLEEGHKEAKTFRERLSGARNSVLSGLKDTRGGMSDLANMTDDLITSMRSIFSIEGAVGMANRFVAAASTVEESLVAMHRRIDLIGETRSDVSGLTATFADMREEVLDVQRELRIGFERTDALVRTLSIDQMRLARGPMREYIASVSALSFATELSEGEAANALQTYQVWYGAEDGFRQLSNQIRFLAATTRMSASEAVDAARSFQDVALAMEMRGRGGTGLAAQINTITAMVRETRGDVSEYAGLMTRLTSPDMATMRQARAQLRAFFQQAGMTVNLDDLIDRQGDLVEVFLQMQEATRALSQDRFMLLNKSMEDLTGVSGRNLLLMRQYEGSLRGISEESAEAATRTDDLDAAAERSRQTLREQADQMRAAFAPMMAELGENIREVVVYMGDHLIPVISEIADNFSSVDRFVESIGAGIDAWAEKYPAFGTHLEGLKEVLSWAWETIQQIGSYLSGIGEDFGHYIEGIESDIERIQHILDALVETWHRIKAFLGAEDTQLRADLPESFREEIRGMTTGELPMGVGPHEFEPMAGGGIIRRPLLLGEGGEEAVIPFDDLGALFADTLDTMSRSRVTRAAAEHVRAVTAPAVVQMGGRSAVPSTGTPAVRLDARKVVNVLRELLAEVKRGGGQMRAGKIEMSDEEKLLYQWGI